MHPFRQGLLEGRRIALTGDVPRAARELLQELGGRIEALDVANPQSPLDALVCGARVDALVPASRDEPSPHTASRDDASPHDTSRDDASPDDASPDDASPDDHIGELLEPEWTAVSAVATGAFIPAQSGRIVLLAPGDGGGVIKAALENLARTLSVEWARYGITTTALVPGSSTDDDDIATVIAYLCSPAGAYFSGCRLDMA